VCLESWACIPYDPLVRTRWGAGLGWGVHRVRADCPNCEAVYDIPDRLLVAGRKVRCARCGQDWFPAGPAVAVDPPKVAEVPVPAPDPVPERAPAAAMTMPPEHNAMDRLAKESVSTPTPMPLKAAWAASAVALVLLVAGAIVWRADIVRAWPPGERLFSVFGTPAEARPSNH